MSKFIILHQSTLDEDGAPTRKILTIDVNVDNIEFVYESERPFRKSEVSFVSKEGMSVSFNETVQEIRNLIAGKCIPGKSYETNCW